MDRTPQPQAPAAPRLVIIDGHAQAFRSFYSLEATRAPDGMPNNALIGFAGVLNRLCSERNQAEPDRVAIVLDAPTEARTTFRSRLFPAYKAQRRPRPEPLSVQLPHLAALTRAYGFLPLHHPEYEADDLAATLVDLAEGAGLETAIHSADKDLMQLVSPRTTVLDTMRGRRFTPQAVQERFGVPPRLIPDWLALVGDASDNIPGVPGLGPRAATKILQAAGGLEEAIRQPAHLTRSHAVKLLAHRDDAMLSLSLTRLRRDVPLASLIPAAPPLDALRPSPPRWDDLDDLARAIGLPRWSLPERPPPPQPPPPPPSLVQGHLWDD